MEGPILPRPIAVSVPWGVDAIYRWLRPVAYQDCPNEYLPAALQNENPLQLHRHLNGVLTKAMV